jgi:hypothetical protein
MFTSIKAQVISPIHVTNFTDERPLETSKFYLYFWGRWNPLNLQLDRKDSAKFQNLPDDLGDPGEIQFWLICERRFDIIVY